MHGGLKFFLDPIEMIWLNTTIQRLNKCIQLVWSRHSCLFSWYSCQKTKWLCYLLSLNGLWQHLNKRCSDLQIVQDIECISISWDLHWSLKCLKKTSLIFRIIVERFMICSDRCDLHANDTNYQLLQSWRALCFASWTSIFFKDEAFVHLSTAIINWSSGGSRSSGSISGRIKIPPGMSREKK